jgi:hypothetical protein
MASVLDFERYSSEINRQLLRRVGYTNGLHKIRRFARLVEYVYPIMPTSARLLAQVIIKEENQLQNETERPLSSTKYAVGIIDVAQALTLLERFGPKIALSSQGYALHAINQKTNEEHVLAFLLEKVIESDGEYALNVLRLVSEGHSDPLEIGDLLTERFLALIEFKKRWVEANVVDRFSQRALVTVLAESTRTLEKAISPELGERTKSRRGSKLEGRSLVELFLKHTVNPRLEWLTDFGLISSGVNLQVTDRGEHLLGELRRLGGWTENFVYLPFDSWLASHLELPNLYEDASSFAWKLVASQAGAAATNSEILKDHSSVLGFVRSIYPSVKLSNFNEADAVSIYEFLATQEALAGRVISEVDFERTLVSVTEEFSSEIFKLSKRRGKGLYIALKKSA